MNIEDFRSLAEHRFSVCLELMCGPKNAEYSRGGDKLHNFKRAGQMLDLHPEYALLGMLSKHMVSIMDTVDDLPELPNHPLFQEKITDAINYLVLLEGLIEERISNGREDNS